MQMMCELVVDVNVFWIRMILIEKSWIDFLAEGVVNNCELEQISMQVNEGAVCTLCKLGFRFKEIS